MPDRLQPLLVALSFLSRLGPARVWPDSLMHASVRWFPVAGLVLGLITTLPLYLGLMAGSPFVQAWVWLVLCLWLTRGLHADGLADLADGLGSGGGTERFWQAVKDSRIGAFGTLALLCVLGGQFVLAADCLAKDKMEALIFAPVLGRSAAVVLAAMIPPVSPTGLGRLIHAGARENTRIAHLGTLAIGLFLIGPLPLFFSLLIAAGLLIWLTQTARKMGGCNGDFLGAAVTLGELTVLGVAAFCA